MSQPLISSGIGRVRIKEDDFGMMQRDLSRRTLAEVSNIDSTGESRRVHVAIYFKREINCDLITGIRLARQDREVERVLGDGVVLCTDSRRTISDINGMNRRLVGHSMLLIFYSIIHRVKKMDDGIVNNTHIFWQIDFAP